ncbi:Lsr2 family protein [Nocardia sp. CDC159]|uniref:Lsr2 family protein n=1 Tax=Nocardia pulmonis TaxID=2951408 RepID=A0A9X2E5J9_9NOCA|nr:MULTISPECIES: Lsr2 family protein [Nocardia]MCM6772021.1 Lsr2 family protein [Nocardia pulmonis]MCM6785321.1 Lsr2 family protein [Nocardia sp. CDC159]
MARKVVVELVDDFDGKSPAEETVSFALDGVEYEIDLSLLNAGRLRAVFEPYTEHGRKLGRGPRPAAPARPIAAREQTAAIRAWARKNGYDVSDRGRIQADVMAAYAKAAV